MIAGELGVLAMLMTTLGESLVLLRQRRPDVEGSRRQPYHGSNYGLN